MSFLSSKDAKSIVQEGSLDAVKLGVAETYISACGVFLGGTALQIGALATVPPLLGACSQLFGMRFAERDGSRKQVIIRLIQLQSLFCFLCSAVLMWSDIPLGAINALIILIALYHVTIGIIAPLWSSFVGDVVPPEIRGRFFGVRNTWMSVVTFLGVVAGGEIIHLFDGWSKTGVGYALIFVIAGVARFFSSVAFRGVIDNRTVTSHELKFSFWHFIRRPHRSNFVKFVFFVGAMNFANAISGPFFAMYMLNDLRFSYSEYMAVVASVVLTQCIVVRSWGMLGDQFGNRKILGVCGLAVCINPLLWLLSSNLWYVVCIQIYSGLFWAGFNLSVANFVFDAVTPPKRARCFAYQALINGVLICSGSLLGALLIKYSDTTSASALAFLVSPSQFLWLFVLSAILRFLAMGLIFPLFSEVRGVPRIAPHVLIARVLSVRPLWGATFTFISGLRRTRGDEE